METQNQKSIAGIMINLCVAGQLRNQIYRKLYSKLEIFQTLLKLEKRNTFPRVKSKKLSGSLSNLNRINCNF